MATPQIRPEADAMDDRRSEARVAVELDARIFPGARAGVIKDLSPRGARVRLDGDPGPDDLILVVWASGQAYEGQAVWWRGDEIGVRFIRTCQLAQPVPLAFREAQQIWQAREGAPALT